jgi:hypothetical protein
MEVHKEQMASVRHFWITKKSECLNIRSIDEVFDIYKNYHIIYQNGAGEKYNFTPLNKYKFRAFIRKNGYDNSSSVKLVKSV